MIPVVLDNYHADGDWTSNNSTNDDTCSYDEQPDGSILISTYHTYFNNDYCHEYWECENPNHNMFFKWNRVQIEEDRRGNCEFDWARFAWGKGDDQQEVICTEDNILTMIQEAYRDTGGNKIVWDFDTDEGVMKWGAEAQIICKDPRESNECIDGTHDCDFFAECVKESGKSGYTCQCPPGGVKWGDKTLTYTGDATRRDPCKYSHPDFPDTYVWPIQWDGETLGVFFEIKTIKWQEAFNRCNELGMTLPLPSNDQQNTALSKFLWMINLNRFYLGAHNSNDNRNWVNIYTNSTI